jgi:hypothetical protein
MQYSDMLGGAKGRGGKSRFPSGMTNKRSRFPSGMTNQRSRFPSGMTNKFGNDKQKGNGEEDGYVADAIALGIECGGAADCGALRERIRD